jgi:hypothetical protein
MRTCRLLLLTMVLLMASMSLACGGSSTATKTPAAAAGAATSVATNAARTATVIATTASGSSKGICAKIPLADVQALTPQTLQPGTDAVGVPSCLFHNPGQDVKVDYYLDDADQQFYKSLSNSTDHQLSGIGDEAYWNEPVEGQTPPYLSAHKGNVTCIIVSNFPPDTTLSFSGGTVQDADALTYAQLLGKVCNDVFAAQ